MTIPKKTTMNRGRIVLITVAMAFHLAAAFAAQSEERAGEIDQATLDAWSAPYRGWHYYADPIIPSDFKIPGHEEFHSFDVPTVYQLSGQPSQWFMSFIGFNGHGYNSFVVESTNLLHWTNPRLAMGFGPTNEFDHGGCVIGAFLYQSYDIKAPRLFEQRDGKYWTLYGCYPRQGGYELRPGYEGVAMSDDGLTWRRAKKAPILSVHDADCGQWEKDCIYQPWLVEHEGRFYDFYNAANGGTEQMGGATSTNLLDWKRYPDNPIVRNRFGGYDSQFCSDGKVFRDHDHWVMFYFGVGRGGAHIMVAFSRDLQHWTSHPEPLYKAGGHPSGLDLQYAHKISLVYNPANDTYYLFYCAVGNKGRCIGLLTSRPLAGHRAEQRLEPLTVSVGPTDVAQFSAPNPTNFQVRPLPGHAEFVFSMYSTPGALEPLKQLVQVMREQRLGNGFDPGPTPHPNNKQVFDYLARVGWPVMCYPGGADMQVKGGRCVLGPENEAALAAMDRAQVFTAVQLGEWGYYFHNLSSNERWWQDVYGKDFEQFKHLMKPPGLGGYDRRPTSRRECYEVLRDYFTSRSRDLLGRVISVTGHSHYEAYAGEWGARCIGLEVGENIAFTQSKFAFARGASRQWQRPWSVQVSPWFSGACTTSGPLQRRPGGARGLDAGHSLSFYERMWLHGWFAGAAMVTPENSIAIFFEKAAAPWELTAHGKKAVEVFQFMRTHERGVPFTPVAILLDHLAGYNGYMDKPWGILEPTEGDRQVRDLFDAQLFPGSDHIHHRPDPNNPESSYLRPTPYGEMFDVQLTGASAEMLSSYRTLLLAGDIEFDDRLMEKLERVLKHGSTVLFGVAHKTALGTRFARFAKYAGAEVLEPWTNPTTGRSAAISDARLRRLAREVLPIEVSGGAIQYQVNRTPRSWVVEVVNNAGVTKKPDQPAVLDPTAIAHVVLRPRIRTEAAREWRTNRSYAQPGDVRLDVGPGQSAFVEFVCP